MSMLLSQDKILALLTAHPDTLELAERARLAGAAMRCSRVGVAHHSRYLETDRDWLCRISGRA
jgi:hypothetical protein